MRSAQPESQRVPEPHTGYSPENKPTVDFVAYAYVEFLKAVCDVAPEVLLDLAVKVLPTAEALQPAARDFAQRVSEDLGGTSPTIVWNPCHLTAGKSVAHLVRAYFPHLHRLTNKIETWARKFYFTAQRGSSSRRKVPDWIQDVALATVLNWTIQPKWGRRRAWSSTESCLAPSEGELPEVEKVLPKRFHYEFLALHQARGLSPARIAALPRYRTHHLEENEIINALHATSEMVGLTLRSASVRAARPKLPQSTSPPPEVSAESLGTSNRQMFLQPLLRSRGWSKLDFANEANLDFKTVQGYLKGRKSYPSTIRKMANALGVDVEKIPV